MLRLLQCSLACELHEPAAVADHAAGHRGRPRSQGGSLQQVLPHVNFCRLAGIKYFVSLPALAANDQFWLSILEIPIC